MKKCWIIFFFVILSGELTGILLNNELLQLVCKPLIVPAIIGYFSTQVNIVGGLAKWALPALLFSLAGDTALLFQDKDPLFFLLGLGAFLVAHIFYIILFYNIKAQGKIKYKALPLLIAAAFYAALISWLFPLLGKMQVPVCIYGLVISTMFMLAMQLPAIKNKAAGAYIFTGALLFVISDSILAVNKFYQPFAIAPVLIMLTYGLAQFLIIAGVAHYIQSKTIAKA